MENSKSSDSRLKATYMAMFTTVEHAAEAIGWLRSLGVDDKDMEVISGVPFTAQILGRPALTSRVPVFGGVGVLVGLVVSLLLNWGTVYLYPLRVGGMPYYPIPTTLVLTFEIAMLGLMLGAFLGVVLDNYLPAYGHQHYNPKISDGQVAILYRCEPDTQTQALDVLKMAGAESVEPVEAKKL